MATASIGFSSSTADAPGWRFSYTFHAKRKLLSLMEFRKAMAFAEKKLQIHRLLLSHELRTYAADVFLDRYVDLINLSASGQLAMRKMFEDHLQRVEWDECKFPMRLYPYIESTQCSSARPIAIDPLVAFGRPIVRRMGISTGRHC